MINFRTFESLSDPVSEPSYIREPQGKLRRTAAVKVWDKIGVGTSNVDERGVFCTDYIKTGECFEVAHLLIVPGSEVKGTTLMDYVFKINDDEYAVAFGSASMYNHRNQPSAEWKINREKKTISFFALRDIQPGEEIYISYGKKYWRSRDISAETSPTLNQK